MFAEVADTCKLQTKQVSVTGRAAVESSVGPGLSEAWEVKYHCFVVVQLNSRPWLHLSSIDKAIARPNLDEACILNGCTNWKEASVFFSRKHDSSKCYKGSVLKVVLIQKLKV